MDNLSILINSIIQRSGSVHGISRENSIETMGCARSPVVGIVAPNGVVPVTGVPVIGAFIAHQTLAILHKTVRLVKVPVRLGGISEPPKADVPALELLHIFKNIRVACINRVNFCTCRNGEE